MEDETYAADLEPCVWAILDGVDQEFGMGHPLMLPCSGMWTQPPPLSKTGHRDHNGELILGGLLNWIKL